MTADIYRAWTTTGAWRFFSLMIMRVGLRYIARPTYVTSLWPDIYWRNLQNGSTTVQTAGNNPWVLPRHCHACVSVCSCSLAVLDPRVGHTMDVLSPFIHVLCHSDWLFHGESCPRLCGQDSFCLLSGKTVGRYRQLPLHVRRKLRQLGYRTWRSQNVICDWSCLDYCHSHWTSTYKRTRLLLPLQSSIMAKSQQSRYCHRVPQQQQKWPSSEEDCAEDYVRWLSSDSSHSKSFSGNTLLNCSILIAA